MAEPEAADSVKPDEARLGYLKPGTPGYPRKSTPYAIGCHRTLLNQAGQAPIEKNPHGAGFLGLAEPA